MRTVRVLPLTAAVVLLALVSPVPAQQAPEGVRVANISYRGSGCPPDSARAIISPHGRALTVLFSAFVARDGPDVPSPDRRRSCRLTVDLDYPQGWQYAIYEVDYRGGALLDEGTWGRQQARLHIRGAGAVPSHMRIDGPYDDDYHTRSSIASGRRGWSRCHRPGPLTIDTSIHVHARHSSTAYMTVDSIDGVVEQTYNIEWRRCEP